MAKRIPFASLKNGIDGGLYNIGKTRGRLIQSTLDCTSRFKKKRRRHAITADMDSALAMSYVKPKKIDGNLATQIRL